MRMLGFIAEKIACKYLEKQGLVLVEKNYRCRWGEVDLIMRDDHQVVFVEVRYRRDQHYGGALESIDRYKQQRIMTTADRYLQQFAWAQRYPSRFDVVILTGKAVSPTIEWLKDAFHAF